VCGRGLCLACAVPVRGQVFGPECLSTVLVDPPPPQQLQAPVPLRGNRLALTGFGWVLVCSIFPWSRFGDTSRYFGAWSSRWSFFAATAALLGVAIAVLSLYRPIDARAETMGYAILAAIVVVAAFTYHRHPPLLSEATAWPLLAALGGAVAMLGAVANAIAMARARKPPAVISPEG
jgi:hypothetical protein